MLQKRPKKTSNVYSKENDPSISNIENMPNRINSGPSKNPNENKKSNSGNNYNIFENLKPGATTKRTKRQKDTKALAKSIIKENPKKSPPKDWDSLASSTELKEAEIKEIPIHAEKAVGYEMHFPTLGSEVPKVEKPEAAFSTDILSPNNVARHQLHMDTTTEASSLVLHDEKSERQGSVGIEEEGTFQKTEEDLGEKEEKVAEYETHFPALGEKVEQPQAENEFRKEILSPKHIGEIAEEIVEQANVVSEPVEWQNPLPKVQHEEITVERDQHVETNKMNHIEISEHEEPALEEEFDTKPIGLIYEELIPQMPLDSTAEDVEPEPAAFPEDAKSPLMRVELESTAFGTPTDLLNEKPVEFQEMLVSEIEQQDQASLVMNQDRDKEKVFEGREQREKQEEELEEYEMVWDSLSEEEEEEEVDHEGYKLIRQPLEYQEEKDLVNHRKEHEEEFGEYKTAPVSVLVREPGQERVKRSVLPPAAEVKIEPVVYAETKTGNEDLDELRSIEEDIVAGSDGEDDVKGKGPVIEDLTASRSTDLTLSACRIDLIREELRESDEMNLNQNALFREIEKNLRIVEGLEQSNMYGAAINMLKKTLDALDTRLVRYHDTNVKEINRLEAECNVELAYCYSNLSDPRAAIEYARNALNLNSKDIKAFYVLGMSLIKCKDHMKGYSTLKEAKKLGPQPKYETYNELIDIEIRKYERKLEQVQEKAKADEEVKRSVPIIEERVIQQVNESNKIERKRSGGRAGSVACFVGTAMTSGLASWFITKNYMNMSEKKSWIYSIGIGALIGGLSLLVLGQVRKGN